VGAKRTSSSNSRVAAGAAQQRKQGGGQQQDQQQAATGRRAGGRPSRQTTRIRRRRMPCSTRAPRERAGDVERAVVGVTPASANRRRTGSADQRGDHLLPPNLFSLRRGNPVASAPRVEPRCAARRGGSSRRERDRVKGLRYPAQLVLAARCAGWPDRRPRLRPPPSRSTPRSRAQ
jgi:hypothetical protein